jgi:hypothetical protein
MDLRGWFRFSDRNNSPYQPVGPSMITTQRLWHESRGSINDPNWIAEDWSIRSVLVPTDKLEEAAETLEESYPSQPVGWRDAYEFDFGEYTEVGGIPLYPWNLSYEDPITRTLKVTLRQDFITYHVLEEREPGRYYHPTANMLVAQYDIDSHRLYKPTPRISVHRDFLKDFLAARGMGLLISIVADRFANAGSEVELEIDDLEDEVVDVQTRISTIVHTPDDTGHPFFRGRSILRRNLVIQPYDKPRIERSPWPYYDELPTNAPDAPHFIVDAEGGKKRLGRFRLPVVSLLPS